MASAQPTASGRWRSCGGSVATLGAIGAPNVRHLIYIAAVVTEAGHPTLSPPASVPVNGRETLRPKVVRAGEPKRLHGFQHAIIGLTKALSNEWAGSGVQVSTVVPGYFRTGRDSPAFTDPLVQARSSQRPCGNTDAHKPPSGLFGRA